VRALIYWSLGGVGGVQRFDALLTRALLDLGVETHVLIPSSINIRSVETYHGVSLEETRIIRYGILNCGGPYCDLVNNALGILS